MINQFFFTLIHSSSSVAIQSKNALKNNEEEWFLFDEMTKSGRVAMVKGVSPIHTSVVAMFAGPMTISNLKTCAMDDEQRLQVNFSDWLAFEGPAMVMDSLLAIRNKWFSYFATLLQNPGGYHDLKVKKDFIHLETLLVALLQGMDPPASSQQEGKAGKKVYHHRRQNYYNQKRKYL